MIAPVEKWCMGDKRCAAICGYCLEQFCLGLHANQKELEKEQSMKISIGAKEMTKLTHLWEFHRKKCDHKADMTIELRSGSGIGTAVVAICGCGEEMDVTDYLSW